MNNRIRILGLIFVGMIFVIGLNTSPVHAATFTASDEASLVAAINSANANTDFDIIELTADINLATTTPYSFNGNTGLPIITKPLAIRGNGHTIRRTSATQFRLLAANATQLWLENLTLAGGDVVGSGGAVYGSGTLTMLDATIGGSEANANRATVEAAGIYFDGDLIVQHSTISYNHVLTNGTTSRGGGMYIQASDVVIMDSTFSHNEITNTNFVSNPSIYGGGLYVSGGNLHFVNNLVDSNYLSGLQIAGAGMAMNNVLTSNITNSTFSNNRNLDVQSSFAVGGGLYMSAYPYPASYTQRIFASEFINNELIGEHTQGGGLYTTLASIYYSNFSGNIVNNNLTDGGATGGGIFANFLYLSNSSVINNESYSSQVGSSADVGAAGIITYLDAVIENTTVSGNRSVINGGGTIAGAGIYFYSPARINNSTIVNNRIERPNNSFGLYGAGIMVSYGDNDVQISNSIISGNKSITDNGATIGTSNCYVRVGSPQGRITSQNYNLFETDGYCETSFTKSNDIAGSVDFAPLANNGGPTLTHIINSVSAINSGSPATIGSAYACESIDQREATRTASCDRGAYESGATIAVNNAPTPVNDSFSTNPDSSFDGLLSANDSEIDFDPTIYHLVSLPQNGGLTLNSNGSFSYVPSSSFEGTDSFNYQVCDHWGLCSIATATILVNSSSTMPIAPSNLRLDTRTASSIKMLWTDNATNESSYVLERQKGENGAWTQRQVLGANTSTFTDTGLSCNLNYSYRVRAYRASDNSYSAPSNILTAMPPCPIPQNLTAVGASYTSINLSWTDTSVNESNYEVYISSDNGTTWTKLASPMANSSSYTATSLTCSTSYQFRVRVYYQTDNVYSDYSSVATGTTNQCPPLPNSPTNLVATANSYTSLTLTWQDNAADETYYRVDVSSDGLTWYNYSSTIAPNTTSYTINNLNCGVTAHFRVRSYRSTPVPQYSDPSNTATITMPSCPPPLSIPSDFVGAAISYTSIGLSWIDTNLEEGGYQLERRANEAAQWTQLTQTGPNASTYTHSNLTCGTSYQYRLRAWRNYPSTSYSDYAPIITVSTLDCPTPPNTPTDFAGVASGYSQINLSWTDTNSDETSYYLEYSGDGGATWPVSYTLSANSVSSIRSAICGNTYNYRLRAYRSNPVPQYSEYAYLTVDSNPCPPPPNAPTNLAISATNYNSITLTWTNTNVGDGGVNYLIERSTDGGTNWSHTATTYYGDTSYVIGGQCGTSYHFRIRANRSQPVVSVSEYSDVVFGTTTTCPTPPYAPTNLAAVATSYTSIDLTWTDTNTDETSYRLERSTNGGAWSQIASLAANTTSISNTTLSCGTNYQYRVRAYRSTPVAQYSDYSEVVSLSTVACPPLPNPPSDLVGVPADYTTINLTWTDTNNDEANYLLERSPNGLSWTFSQTLAANTTSFSDTGLACGATYYYRMRTLRSYPKTEYSPFTSIMTVATNTCPPLPTAPTNLVTTAISPSIINLIWTDNDDSETAYRIERSLNGTSSWTSLTPIAANSTTYSSTSLSCNTSYYFRVAAVNVAGSSEYSNIASATTLGCPPNAPTSLTGTVTGKNTISLTWTDNATNETAYYLERSADSGVTWTVFNALSANSTSYGDTALYCGTSYRYRVRAYRGDANVYSGYSSTVTYTTQACTARPAAPSSIALSRVNSSRIDISWTDNATNESSYFLQRSSDNGTTWQALMEIPANSASYSDTTVTCNQYYRYRVAAFNNTENSLSTWLTSINARTICAPTDLQTVLSSYGTIGLTWTNTLSNQAFVERSSDNGTSWTVLVNLNFGGNDAYTNTGLTCGTSYQYRVRFYDGSAYSDYSSVLTASTQDCYGFTDAMCTLEQINLSHPSTNILGPIFMSANGNRIAINYQAAPIVSTYPAGMYLYDIASETVVQDFADAAFGDISADGSRLVFMSSANPLGQNADGNEEIFYWNNGTYTQLTNTTIADAVKQPQMSADGSIVVFAGDGDIVGDATAGTFLYIWDATNGVRKLIPEAGVGDLALSGDGSTVVFVHGSALSGQSGLGSRQLYRWNASDGVQLLYALTNPQSFYGSTFALHINHDGSRIAFVDKNDPLSLNPDGTDDVFLWDAATGLQQLTESSEHIGFLAGMDASGERIAFFTGLDLDTDSTAPSSIGYYFFDEGYGFSQITSVPIGDWTTMGQALSADGLKAAFIASVGWDGVSSVYPYLEVFVGDCTPANNFPEPTNLTATLNGANIDLAWTDNASSETEYRIERSADGITWTELAPAPYNSTSYSDTTVLCATTYDYRVRAYRSNDASYSAYSNIATETSIACPPLAPTTLSITGTTQTSISLAWTDNSSDETSFVLERSIDNGTTWAEVQSLASDSSSHTDSSLTCNTSYSYRLRAYRSGDNQYSSYSNVVNGSTTLCPVAPPTGLVVTSTGHTNVNLAWTDNSSDEANFVLERSADSGATWTEISQPAANSTSYNDTSPLCNTSYDYRLRAFRSVDSQSSSFSNVVTATTDICITLNAASDIQQTANSQTGMSLSWTDNSTNESGYEIERSADGTTWQLLSSLPADSTSYTDSGLACATGYFYRIRSNHLGTGAYSPYATSSSLMTAACSPLVASVLSTTGTTQNSISLSWTVDNNATSFTLAFYNGSTWQNLGIFASSTTTYTHTGLLCGNNYQYRITTFRSNDSASLDSDTHLSSTAACPPLVAPNAPVLVDAQPALIRLQIPTMPATATSMSLERSMDGITWTNLGAASNFFNDTGVLCGNSYQYRLVAYRSTDGASATSPSTVAMTDMCPIPTTLGIYRNGLWLFVESNNTTVPVISFNNGDAQWQPLVGDWDGDGIDGIGIYRNGEFILRNSAAPDALDTRFVLGNTEGGWRALVGDWDGDGIDTVGIYKAGLFILSNDNQNFHYQFNFGDGQTDWQALAGDWNADGRDGIGLYRNGRWILTDDVNNPTLGNQSISYGPQQAGWIAIVGDWNGDGFDSIGFFNNGLWRMRVNSIHDLTELSVNFGQAGDIPLSIFDND